VFREVRWCNGGAHERCLVGSVGIVGGRGGVVGEVGGGGGDGRGGGEEGGEGLVRIGLGGVGD